MMARRNYQIVGGHSSLRVEGPVFRPREVSRALNAFETLLRNASGAEFSEALGASPRSSMRPSVLVTRIEAGGSWEVGVALRVIPTGVALATQLFGPVTNWPTLFAGIADRVAGAFGGAEGVEVIREEVGSETTAAPEDALEGGVAELEQVRASAMPTEAPPLAEDAERLIRALQVTGQGGEVQLPGLRVVVHPASDPKSQ